MVDWHIPFHEWKYLYSGIHYWHINPGSESMHSRNINADYEWVRMFHWTVLLIKINTFNLKAPICTVVGNKFMCIITVTFLNNSINEWMKDFCSFMEVFDWGRSQKKADICFYHIAQTMFLSGIVSEDLLNINQYSLVWEVPLGDTLQHVKP